MDNVGNEGEYDLRKVFSEMIAVRDGFLSCSVASMEKSDIKVQNQVSEYVRVTCPYFLSVQLTVLNGLDSH